MDQKQILDMISVNRESLRGRSSIALHNLALLHKNFDAVTDENCIISLALNDSVAAVTFGEDYTAAIEISQAVTDKYANTADPYLLACHESTLGKCYTHLVRYDDAHIHLLRAQELAAPLPDSDTVTGLRADILHNLAMNNHRAGRNEEQTAAYLHTSLAILQGHPHDVRRGLVLIGLGNVALMKDNLAEALAYQLEAVKLFEEHDSYINLAVALCNTGMCYTALGKPNLAEPYLQRALELRTRLGNYSEIAATYFHLAKMHRTKGDHAKAYEILLLSRDYALVSQVIGRQLLVLEELEDISAQLGDKAGAVKYHEELMQIVQAAGLK